jgi:hypothetical protein
MHLHGTPSRLGVVDHWLHEATEWNRSSSSVRLVSHRRKVRGHDHFALSAIKGERRKIKSGGELPWLLSPRKKIASLFTFYKGKSN